MAGRSRCSKTALVILLCAVLSACASQKTQPGTGDGTPAPGASPPPVIFPHASGWKDPSSHGEWVVKYGLGACLACHKKDSDKKEESPTCSSCHPLYPHVDKWVQKEQHGAAVQKTGKSVCATACHGTDLEGGLSGISCNACHKSYPHSKDWPDTHGTATIQAGKEECRSCHGANYSGGTSGVSCYDIKCHATYPHEAEWSAPPGTPQKHAQYVKDNTSASCAKARCHGTDLEGGASRISCNACHKSYPHPAGWISGAKHGPMALVKIADCKSCHGADLDKAPAGHKSCVECHPSYLKHDTAEMGLAARWRSRAGHGLYVTTDPATQKKDVSECRLCHGNDFAGGLSGISCLTPCHNYPHSAIADWESKKHGAQSLSAQDRDGCRACHGADLLGGDTGISCTKCHTTFPHGADWRTTGQAGQLTPHGTDFIAQKKAGFPASFNACPLCHGADYKGGNSKVACESCHQYYPHTPLYPDWNAPNQERHASAYLDGPLNLNSPCADCHTGLRRGPGGEANDCASCHGGGYPHFRKPDLGVDDWIFRIAGGHNHYGDFVINSINELPPDPRPNPCKGCHGDDLLGNGVPAKNCTRCHVYYYGAVSHEALKWRKASAHGKNYIKARLLGSPDNEPDRCDVECHSAGNRRQPSNVCNPFTRQFPNSGLDWCRRCHDKPAGPCPPLGCPPDGVCP